MIYNQMQYGNSSKQDNQTQIGLIY